MFRWFKAPSPPEVVTVYRDEVRDVVRLQPDEYLKLEQRLPNTHRADTPEGYAYRLGVQHALKLLREGWCVNDS